MSDYALFYNSEEGDRKYNADSFSEWLKPFFKNGVFNGELEVVANENFRLNVTSGNAYIDGKLRYFEDVTSITIDKPSSILNRIDRVVVRRNDTDRNFTIEVLKGTLADNPVAPALTRENGIYELCLAQIYVGASVTEITQSVITDTRTNSDLCGYVCATVEQIDFEQITKQWSEYVSEFTASQLAEFNQWFNTIKGQLSEDVAGKLQLEIDKNKVEHFLMVGLTDGSKTFSDDGSVITSTDSSNRKLVKTFTNNFLTCTSILYSNTGVELGRMVKQFSADGKTIDTTVTIA